MSMDIELLIAAKTCMIFLVKFNFSVRKYNHKGQPVFMVAALGVVLDTESNTVKVFGGQETKMVAKNVADDSKFHMDDILSLDLSADRKVVVTG